MHASEQERPDVAEGGPIGVARSLISDQISLGRLIFLDETGARTGHDAAPCLVGYHGTRALGHAPGTLEDDDLSCRPHCRWQSDRSLASTVRSIARRSPNTRQARPGARSGRTSSFSTTRPAKGEEAAEPAEGSRRKVPLPPSYSPDLNPIEMAFSKLKTLLRKAERRTRETLWQMIGQLLSAFTPDECINYIRHAGYAS